MRRIGILGGTFNPIHIGHLVSAQFVSERLKLDKVIFIPSYLPPNKSRKAVIDAVHRYNMVKLAIKGNDLFDVSDFEIKKKGVSYSIDTLEFFHKNFSSKIRLFFIIGTDNIAGLHTWHRIDDILRLATFVAVSRPGTGSLRGKIDVRRVDIPVLDISSSFIRKRIASGKTVRYLIPDAVIRYIQRHKLYTSKI